MAAASGDGGPGRPWFVDSPGGVLGPLTAEELKSLVKEGLVDGETRIGRAAGGPWRRAAEYRGLVPADPAGGTRERTGFPPPPARPPEPEARPTVAARRAGRVFKRMETEAGGPRRRRSMGAQVGAVSGLAVAALIGLRIVARVIRHANGTSEPAQEVRESTPSPAERAFDELKSLERANLEFARRAGNLRSLTPDGPELVEPGEGERRTLAFSTTTPGPRDLKVDFSIACRIHRRDSAGEDIAGKMSWSYDLTLDPEATGEDGRTPCAVTVQGARVAEATGSFANGRDEFDAEAEDLAGCGWDIVLDGRGPWTTNEPGVDVLVLLRDPWVRDTGQISFPLPKEAVGDGALWETVALDPGSVNGRGRRIGSCRLRRLDGGGNLVLFGVSGYSTDRKEIFGEDHRQENSLRLRSEVKGTASWKDGEAFPSTYHEEGSILLVALALDENDRPGMWDHEWSWSVDVAPRGD